MVVNRVEFEIHKVMYLPVVVEGFSVIPVEGLAVLVQFVQGSVAFVEGSVDIARVSLAFVEGSVVFVENWLLFAGVSDVVVVVVRGSVG